MSLPTILEKIIARKFAEVAERSAQVGLSEYQDSGLAEARDEEPAELQPADAAARDAHLVDVVRGSLVSGPTTAISIAVFAALSHQADPGSPQYIQLVLTLTFLVGLFKLILGLAESLNDEQMLWKPPGYNNSIAFNLWHIARWSDNLIAEILTEFADLDLGDAAEIWVQESLAVKWGLPPVLYPGGTGLSDEAAAGLIFPGKEEMLAYLRKTFSRTEEFIEKFEARYPGSEPVADEAIHKKLTDIRWYLYYYLMHHCRHLGMMEALKGLLTGKGSAAA